MLDVEFKIKNYRCFGDEPITFRVRDGFTALVGTNNSGKSSLLRLPYEIRPLLNELQVPERARILTVDKDRYGRWAPNLLAGERFIRADSNHSMEIQIIVHDGPAGSFAIGGEKVVASVEYASHAAGSGLRLQTHSRGDLTPEDGQEKSVREALEPLSAAMEVFSDAMYIGPFRNAIHSGGNGSYYDIQTGTSFISAFGNFKSGIDPDANEAVYSMTEDLRRIFGFDRLEINPSGDTLQLIIDGRSHRLSEMGAGFAHFVVVMASVLVRKPKLLLIDEPELNLHASLQLDFLQALAKYAEHGVIFATHSLGLARTVADQVYTLSKPPGQQSRLNTYEDDQDLVTLLGQLSFDRRPELGFNKVLLVEGKTEVRALTQLLRLYGKEHEVLMIPLHGHDLIRGDSQQELTDLLRIGKDVRYLIDSEREAAEEELEVSRGEFVKLCASLNIPGCVLERRALENYFSDRAVKRAFGNSCQALGPYGKLARARGAAWRKTNNWRAAAEMERRELDGTDLGEFLESL